MRFVIYSLAGLLPLFPMGALTEDEDVEATIHQVLERGLKSHQEFETVHQCIMGNSEVEKWRSIDWIPDLWEARKVAAVKGRPLFIWAMNGDPLGCV